MRLIDYLSWKDISIRRFSKIIGVTPMTGSRYARGLTEPDIETSTKIIEWAEGHITFQDLRKRKPVSDRASAS